MNNANVTLSVGKYSIDLVSTGFGIFIIDEADNKEWVATAADPEIAMRIVEGLIMVETKRFYHPESKPSLSGDGGKPLPPFLKKVAEKG